MYEMGFFRRKAETESEKIAKISKQVEKEWTRPSPKWGVEDPRIKTLETLHENDSLLKKSKDTGSLNMFSLIAFEYKRYDEAIEWAKCALAINPKNKISIGRLASIFMKIKDYRHALHWAKELVEVWPTAGNYYFLASLYYRLDTLPNFKNFARDNINKALKLSPHNEKYHDFRNEIDFIDSLDDEED